MIGRERRTHSLPKARPYRRRSRTRSTRSKRTRYETTAQVGMFTTGKRTSRTRKLYQQWQRTPEPRSQQRRSKARLGGKMRASRLKESWAWIRNTTGGMGMAARWNGRLYLNVLALGLLVWLAIWFFVSDRFYISQIVVSGNVRVSDETIAKASGLQGYSIFWVNPGRVAATLLESIPPLQQVVVRYHLPNTVRITVREENSQLMWEIAGLRYWVASDGALQPVEEGCEASLIIRDRRMTLPDQIELDALVAARQLAHLLPEAQVIEYSPAMGLYYRHPRGWDVYLGSGDDMSPKVGALRAMEVQYAGKETDHDLKVGLRYQNGIYLRPESPAENED